LGYDVDVINTVHFSNHTGEHAEDISTDYQAMDV